MKILPLFAIGFILFSLAGPARGSISPDQLRAVLGDHEGVEWSVDDPRYWSVSSHWLALTSPARDSVHFLEAAVNGPGVLELSPATFLGRFEGSILVNGVQSGGILAGFGNNRIQVGEGSHTIRLELKNIATLQPAVVQLNPARWGRFSEVTLQAAGVSAGAVTLTGDWIGQDRVHRGGGSAAWSGIQVFGLPLEPLTETVMRAEFSGAGVIGYHYFTDVFSGNVRYDGGEWETMLSGGWHRVVRRVAEGKHLIEWKAASGNSEYRSDRDLFIDEIRFSPEVSLADALETPEWIWEGIDGGQGRPFGTEDPEAKGGALVIMPNRSSISTEVPGGGILRIRYKGHRPSAAVGGESVSLLELINDPDVAGSNYKIGVVSIPPSGGLLQISTHWQIEVDSVEWITPPPTLAATLGLPEIITSGGAGSWTPVPDVRLGRYVAELTVPERPAEGWFEFPVAGPAEVTIAFLSRLEFFVDGRRVWIENAPLTNRVTIEVPAGTHVLRCAGSAVAYSSSNARITEIAIKPLATEGTLGAAMDHPAAWASRGGWESSDVLTYDGVDALRPSPPPNPSADSTSNHMLQTPVSGPGFVRFMTYVQRSPDARFGLSIGWWSNVHQSVFRRFADEPQGWLEHRMWYPPGEHWIRWSVSGTEHELSLVALDQFVFEASEVLSFDEIVGNVNGVWANDPDRPWSGVRKEAGGDAWIISPMIGPDEPAEIALAVEGPGDLHFHWSNGAKGSTVGSLWINGVKTSQQLPRHQEGNAVTLSVPHDGSVTLEWRFEARFEDNWAAMKDVVWTPWPEVSLAEALDAPEQVTWETSAALPFKGRPDGGAKNGSAAQVGLMPGEETWLEATVSGPGLFDFWLRGVPGAMNDPRDVEWELFINGIKSHIPTHLSTWPAQWVLEDGEHKIRLVFRNTSQIARPAFIAVDDISWAPLIAAEGGEGWTASHPELAQGFIHGGLDDGPQHVIPVATGDVRWIEKTVTGPGVLAWNARLMRGWFATRFKGQVLVNGICVLPPEPMQRWETKRLHLPEGVHTVRWTSEPEHSGEAPYRTHADAIWQVSNVVFTPGTSSLMRGIDNEEVIWVEVGSSEGRLVGADESYDGIDAWALGEETVLYLSNATTRGIKAQGMVFRSRDAGDGPGWAQIFGWAGPGESVEWVRKGIVDTFTMEEMDVVPFAEAVDSDQDFAVHRWVGLAEAGQAFDGIDAAWSLLNRRYGSNSASLTLEGPAKMRFRWRATGTGTLALRVNGAWLPVPSPGRDWREVEFEVYEPTLVQWVHARAPETSDEAVGEAWLDSVVIESRSHRTIHEVAGDGSGLIFESTAGATEANQWRAAAYRDAMGVWREGARGITGAAGLETTVTGPALVSFRTYRAGVNIPASAVVESSADSLEPQSVIIIIGPGVITTQRFLSVRVGDREKLRIIPEDGDGWTDHLIHVPAGEHRVVWRLGRVTRFGMAGESMEEWQAWVGEVTLLSPRDHYNSWANRFLGDYVAREPGDDANGNGVINFLEYAYGSDPRDEFSEPLEMFAVVQPGSDFYFAGVPEDIVLHVPRIPPHVTAVLETSTDLATWMPSPVQLRSFPAPEPDSVFGLPRNYDSGPYQVILFPVDPEQPANFFRLVFDLPEDGE